MGKVFGVARDRADSRWRSSRWAWDSDTGCPKGTLDGWVSRTGGYMLRTESVHRTSGRGGTFHEKKVKSLSHVRLLAIPWTAAHQAPPSMGFSRQEYWSGVPLSRCLNLCHKRWHQVGINHVCCIRRSNLSFRWEFHNLGVVWLINILGMSEDMACLNRKYCFVTCFSCITFTGWCMYVNNIWVHKLKIASVPLLQLWLPPGAVSRRPGTSSLYKMSKDRQGPSEKQLLRSDRTMTPDTGKGKARMEIQRGVLHAWLTLKMDEAESHRGTTEEEGLCHERQTRRLKEPVGPDVKCRSSCACCSRGPGKTDPGEPNKLESGSQSVQPTRFKRRRGRLGRQEREIREFGREVSG